MGVLFRLDTFKVHYSSLIGRNSNSILELHYPMQTVAAVKCLVKIPLLAMQII